MLEVKNFSGRMNFDDSPYRVPPNDYITALNITKDAIEGSNDKVITNIVGNRLVSYTYQAGTNITIGAKDNPVRNTVIELAWNSNGYHSIIEYDNAARTRTKIFENLTDSNGVDILGFTLLGKIVNINIYNQDTGDLLFFLDSLGRPTVMNITEFKAGTYTPVTRQLINVIKAPPLSPPSYVYGNDTTRRVNNCRNRFFRFAYLFIYDENFETVISPISEVTPPVNVLDDTYTSVVTNNNVITVSMESGAKNVKKVQLLMSYAEKANEWTDFEIVDTIVKADESISDDIIFAWQFYNDSTYPVKDINQVVLLYDYVPDLALAQEMPNGNVLMYSGITEGYDKQITPNVVNTVSSYFVTASQQSNLNVSIIYSANSGGNRKERWLFSGSADVGTTVVLTVKYRGGALVTAASYTVQQGDSINTIVDYIVNNLLTPGGLSAFNFGFLELLINRTTFEEVPPSLFFSLITITPHNSTLFSNSITTWKWSTERNIGTAYFDQNGKTNGILYNAKITFPAFQNNGSGQVALPTINTKIYHQPPDWAYSYQFYFTKEGTSYLFWECLDVNLTETDSIYFDVTNFLINAKKNPTTATVCSYSFQDGDRLRLIQPTGINTYFADTYDAAIIGLLADPNINGVVQTGKLFIKIKKSAPFTNATFAANPKRYTIEIYRPAQKTASKENEVFYEFGSQWAIIDPTLSTRVHAGQVTTQSTDYATPAEFNFTKGDSYFRLRVIPTSATAPGSNTIVIQDRNIVDFYVSAVNSIDGRPNVIDPMAAKRKYGATSRFGQEIQAYTNINGLNRFYPNNIIDCDISYGDIMRLKVRDRFVRVFQKLKTGMMPLFNQINKSPDGTTINVVTDKLLNPIQYYIGDFGIGDNPESLASYNYADYFTSNIKGVICRASQDGINAISIEYSIDSWAWKALSVRGASYKMYGCFNQILGDYVLALEAAVAATIDYPAETIVFAESPLQQDKGFVTYLSYQPEMMVNLGTLFITFKDGQLYTHDSDSYNTFYGASYDSSVTTVFNQNSLEKKTFQAIDEVASVVWDCPSITTDVNSYGTTKQATSIVSQRFRQLEGSFSSVILRDSNSRKGIVNGDTMKGKYAIVKFRALTPTNLITLHLVSLKTVDSPLTVTNKT